MRRPVLNAVAVGFVLAATAAAATPDWGALDLHPYDPPRPAPAFALPDLEGRIHRLEDLRGKTVLLFFWATW